MSNYERKAKRSGGTITLSLHPNEGILEAVSLHVDLMTAIAQDGIKKLRLDAALTESVNTTFVQLVMSAKATAQHNGTQFEVKNLSEDIEKRLLNYGVVLSL